MERFTYTPTGVCSRKIDIEMDGRIVSKVAFTGGCAGNTQGVAALIAGMDVDEAISRISGIKCGYKPTSCPDQLAAALTEIKKQMGI